MDHFNHNDDLDLVGRLLREHRPQLEALELDRVKLRSHARARGSRPTKGSVMKSRLAILGILVLGIMMSGAGTSMVIANGSGEGNRSNAADTVYDDDDAGRGDFRDGDGDLDARGQEKAAGDDGGDGLPFTGFLAVPLLIGGIGLLGTGLLIRRRAR
jgi:hypothetical protein